MTTGSTSRNPSRAGSTAREILKRREKPYKTEQQRVFAKKRKLDIHTSFREPPPGYVSLPVGTPELAERCKELSRQRGLPVSLVNSKPTSKDAENPQKISHHIHRVGYHFRAEVVEDACEQLKYTVYDGKFMKESDLPARSQGLHSTLLKYGIDPAAVNQFDNSESPDKVGAAIKELFPRIPDQDLNEIVHHAWEEGTRRVGTISTLELPRRVQLATTARIRHMYTDYDRLLRAFEWKEARSMVEADCLKKLIEWRGEHPVDDADDEELEEIVRETIVLDDDDQTVSGNSSEADDEGDTSDASVEITHVTDFGAESGVDDRTRRWLDRSRPRQKAGRQRAAIAKQKIGAARQQLRAPAPNPLPATQSVAAHPGFAATVPSRETFVNRQRYMAVPTEQPAYQHFAAPRNGAYSPTYHTAPHHAQMYASVNGRPSDPVRDLPVASIETDDGTSRPTDGRMPIRSRNNDPYVSPRERRQWQAPGVVDLTSPARPGQGARSSNAQVVRETGGIPAPASSGDSPLGPPLQSRAVPLAPVGYRFAQVEEYDPTRPLIQARPQAHGPLLQRAPEPSYVPQYTSQPPYVQQPYTGQDLHPVHGAPAPVQQAPREVVAQAPYLYAPLAAPQSSPYYPTNGAPAPTQYYYPR
ncbi:hypothetical protein KC332_g10535 [Hortaea werneckii]|uniref:DUF2293 domain-containing protein n=1 Tax=Hortaea werneckii EXF-2000 TaxID=1157616 RepID=A0A1Z5SVG3_HORWE|nr:hypothetical protein KC350_g10678 [Hortaea werneckii]OTA24805.1 hypothetical protein BTJ68_13328 [Hortaea werneckii EXF-2000]KAI6841579.1 hypothetical protein KC358_g4170 [Hortaea werneckii]KAI6928207.1 hypothetical protein KC341_g11667 [Hortaea werneckii]KAI6947321.1 hypothetical protein KC348_g2602 [Hortaea werneckii]